MIKELHPGDTQISAAGWNEMRAAVQGITPGQQQYQSNQRSAAYITIKNQTIAGDIPAFSVVKIDGAMYNRSGDTFINQAAQNGVELSGNTPAATTDVIAITQAACKSGDIVKAMVSGATACKVYKAENRAYKYAAPTPNQTGYLTGTDDVTGIRVLWSASGTGAKEAYVLLEHNAQFITLATVYGSTGGSNTVYADINGVTYEILFPDANTGLSGASYPDIYPDDQITVLVDLDTGECYAIDYPRDYPEGTVIPWFSNCNASSAEQYRTPYLPGRGWTKYNPYQDSWTDSIAVEYIDARNRHLQNGAMYLEKGVTDKVPVSMGCLIWIEKVKTDAIL